MNLWQCSKTKYNRLQTHLRFTTLHYHHLSRLLSFSACFIIITTKVHSTKMIMCTLDLISFTISVVNHIVFSFQYFASVKKAQWKNIYSRVKKFNYVFRKCEWEKYSDNSAVVSHPSPPDSPPLSGPALSPHPPPTPPPPGTNCRQHSLYLTIIGYIRRFLSNDENRRQKRLAASWECLLDSRVASWIYDPWAQGRLEYH